MKVAVSACLLGTACRYDGTARPCEAVCALRYRDDVQLVPVCPEVLGELSIPHPPNEIVTSENTLRVVDAKGNDTTEAFVRGGKRTLERVQDAGCDLAILKSKSPSCGSGKIYDGTFTKTLVAGYGVAARMLYDAGIRVIDETEVDQLL